MDTEFKFVGIGLFSSIFANNFKILTLESLRRTGFNHFHGKNIICLATLLDCVSYIYFALFLLISYMYDLSK